MAPASSARSDARSLGRAGRRVEPLVRRLTGNGMTPPDPGLGPNSWRGWPRGTAAGNGTGVRSRLADRRVVTDGTTAGPVRCGPVERLVPPGRTPYPGLAMARLVPSGDHPAN